MQGPETDVEQQTKESWSELVSAHQKRKAEQLLRESKLAQLDQEDSQRQAARSHDGSGKGEEQSSDKRDDECTWGIDVDESQDDGEMGVSMLGLGLEGGSCLSHESSYAEDPKRALKNYFDREGFDPPQYDFVEGRFGQKNCRIE
ncbi:unnamed protein product [Dibothriocephalus latus]|uniref:Uncharacterized protein n=1 Tax=Dibothriocephalus latus TaxID=60516 RepID=A0A3P7KWJ3_DIBLA|nr:unnamed protein product [Dibothriocephalus latus]